MQEEGILVRFLREIEEKGERGLSQNEMRVFMNILESWRDRLEDLAERAGREEERRFERVFRREEEEGRREGGRRKKEKGGRKGGSKVEEEGRSEEEGGRKQKEVERREEGEMREGRRWKKGEESKEEEEWEEEGRNEGRREELGRRRDRVTRKEKEERMEDGKLKKEGKILLNIPMRKRRHQKTIKISKKRVFYRHQLLTRPSEKLLDFKLASVQVKIEAKLGLSHLLNQDMSEFFKEMLGKTKNMKGMEKEGLSEKKWIFEDFEDVGRKRYSFIVALGIGEGGRKGRREEVGMKRGKKEERE